jgi:hypothetical protein
MSFSVITYHKKISSYRPESSDGFVKNIMPGKLFFYSIIKQYLCNVHTWHVPELIRSAKRREIEYSHLKNGTGHINGAHHVISVCLLVVLV